MRDLKWIIIFLISLFILLVFAVHVATGAEQTIVKAPIGALSSRQIAQMDTVCWGETVDLALVEGWDGTVMHEDTEKKVDVSSFTHRILIRSDVFPLGTWLKGSTTDAGAENNVAFYVVSDCSKITGNVNETVENETNTTAVTIVVSAPESLAKIHVADILIAQGDRLSYRTGEEGEYSKAWIFGSSNMLLDLPLTTDGYLILNSTQTQALTSGSYHLIVEGAGDNTIVEAKYVNASVGYPSTTKHIESQFRTTPNLEIEGLGSQVLYQKFKAWLKQYSDDNTDEISFEVQKPALDINAIDETTSRDDTTIWQVRGYTNLARDTDIRAILDENKTTARTLRSHTANSTIFGDQPGDMREFAISLPIDYDEMTTGEHSVTVRSAYDTFVTVSRWVYVMPAGQERPMNTTKYSGGNLFVPTPTPEVITVTQQVEVVRTVIVTITPEPTPTPVPTPWFFESPWIFIEIIVTIFVAVLFAMWVLWKYGKI